MHRLIHRAYLGHVPARILPSRKRHPCRYDAAYQSYPIILAIYTPCLLAPPKIWRIGGQRPPKCASERKGGDWERDIRIFEYLEKNLSFLFRGIWDPSMCYLSSTCPSLLLWLLFVTNTFRGTTSRYAKCARSLQVLLSQQYLSRQLVLFTQICGRRANRVRTVKVRERGRGLS